jgi:hypothetical protein
VGQSSEASGEESVAIGGSTTFGLIPSRASGTGAAAFGAGAWATEDYATAIGWNRGSQCATALGANATATGSNSVALCRLQGRLRDNTVAVGKAGGERQVTHVAAGTATDAVNRAS